MCVRASVRPAQKGSRFSDKKLNLNGFGATHVLLVLSTCVHDSIVIEKSVLARISERQLNCPGRQAPTRRMSKFENNIYNMVPLADIIQLWYYTPLNTSLLV